MRNRVYHPNLPTLTSKHRFPVTAIGGAAEAAPPNTCLPVKPLMTA
jgi:hypothetical protein